MNYSTIALLLIPAVVGYTEGIKDQFPVVKGIVPLISILVAVLLYLGYHYLPTDLFQTIMGAGSAMGYYTGVKLVGGSNSTTVIK